MSDPLRVLVVDDSVELLELLGEYLKVRHMQVQTSPDVESALRLLRTVRFDLILADHNPPSTNAFALLAAARERDRALPVLFMARHPRVDAAVAAFKSGASDYLIKPFKLKEAYDALIAAVGRQQEQRSGVESSELMEFLEFALKVEEDKDRGRLTQLFLSVARNETRSDEAAVWVTRGGALVCVGHSGHSRTLLAYDPGAQAETMFGGAGLLVMPLRHGRRRVGVVAVAGGEQKRTVHLERLKMMGRAFCDAITRQ